LDFFKCPFGLCCPLEHSLAQPQAPDLVFDLFEGHYDFSTRSTPVPTTSGPLSQIRSEPVAHSPVSENPADDRESIASKTWLLVNDLDLVPGFTNRHTTILGPEMFDHFSP
jgi:hypothetical protein